MKRNPRRKTPVAASAILTVPVVLTAPAALFLLLFAVLPLPFAAAQSRTEEWVDTGRFGAEEPENGGGAAAARGINSDRLYLGLRAGPSLRFYTSADDTPYTGGDTHAPSLDMAFQANLRILSFLSVQAEALFTWDNASVWAYRSASPTDRYTKDYTAFSLQFPLLVRLDFYPGKFRVSPFLGVYYLLALGKLKASESLQEGGRSLDYRVSPPIGLLGGLSGAVKFGPGMIFADLRYAADLGTFRAGDGSIEEFRRGMVSLTAGYELGFFAKKQGGRP
jgi:hypothetical protein